MKTYRDNGAIGALLDEYEKAIIELQELIANISKDDLIAIVDPNSDDPDCRSIQTILTHVIGSGYGYAVMTRNHLGESIPRAKRSHLDSAQEYVEELSAMFRFNEQLFDDYPKLELSEHDPEKKILTPWKQRFDVDQMFEHAIVHILRHRRQIERFLLKL